MVQRLRSLLLASVALAALAAPCAAQAPARPASAGAPRHTAADVAFMRGMIAHHARALVMAGMAPSHGGSFHAALLARRIIVSQRDEFARMREMLEGMPSDA